MSKHKLGPGEMSEKWTHLLRGTLLYVSLLGIVFPYVLRDVYFIEYLKEFKNAFVGYIALNSFLFFWRNSVKMMHWIRALFYMVRLKIERRNLDYSKKYDELCYVITAYDMEKVVIANMVNNLLLDLLDYGVNAYLFCSFTPGERGDRELIFVEKLIEDFKSKNSINFEIIVHKRKQARGDAKRGSQGVDLRKDFEDHEKRFSDEITNFLGKTKVRRAIILMDGDTIVTPKLHERILPFLMKPSIGAVFGHCMAYISSDIISYIQYYHYRMSKRLINLSSVPTVLTGRWVAFKGEVVDQEFINLLVNHIIDHPVFGKYRALTGDDKTTFLSLLIKKYSVRFVFDCAIFTQFDLPKPESFFDKVHWFINIQKDTKRYVTNMINFSEEVERKVGFGNMPFSLWVTVNDQGKFFFTPTLSLLSFVFLLVFVVFDHSIGYAWKTFLLGLSITSLKTLVETFFIFALSGHWSPHWLYLIRIERQVNAFQKIRKKAFPYIQGWRAGLQTGDVKYSSYVVFFLMWSCMSLFIIYIFNIGNKLGDINVGG